MMTRLCRDRERETNAYKKPSICSDCTEYVLLEFAPMRAGCISCTVQYFTEYSKYKYIHLCIHMYCTTYSYYLSLHGRTLP